MLVRSALAATVVLAATMFAPEARAGMSEDITLLYERFVAAQNSRDVGTVRSLLLSSDRFLWVSDGKAFWGPDTMIERMSRFQEAEVWDVEPDRARRRFVQISEDSGYLYQPLALRIGPASRPDTIPFLVSVLCVRTGEGWRIAALLTTVEKP